MNALQSVSRAEKNSYSDVLSNRSLGMGVKRQDVAVRFDDGAVQVEVPWDARDGVSLQSSLGSISVGLPFASNLALSDAWAETLDKGAQSGYPNANTPSMKVQFDCHYIFVRVRNVNKASWNLDTKLPVTDLLTSANYGCNYPVGDTVFG
jgi:hypothetical protein